MVLLPCSRQAGKGCREDQKSQCHYGTAQSSTMNFLIELKYNEILKIAL